MGVDSYFLEIYIHNLENYIKLFKIVGAKGFEPLTPSV